MHLCIVFMLLLPLLIASVLSEYDMFESMNTALVGRKNTQKEKPEENATICYADIDCFARNGPLKHINQLPAAPQKINTLYRLYRRSKNVNDLNTKSDESFKDMTQTLAIIIHGFSNTGQKSELLALKDSLILFGNITSVLIVDWSKGAELPWYREAVANTQVVGRQITLLVNNLKQKHGIDPKKVHLLGYSLGAHIAGFAGKYSQFKYKWKFGRITALDAAAPLFEGFNGSHLTKEDAIFVDAIHTSAGNNILRGDVGFKAPLGHIDFYPNNGTRQPRCQNKTLLSSCNHNSALHYMESSLRAHRVCAFTAFKCNSWTEYISGNCKDKKGNAIMGYYSIHSKGRGRHYLTTTANYPYCSKSTIKKFIRKL